MNVNETTDLIREPLPRRDFLRGVAGGALALASGQLLAGCGGGGSGNTPGTGPAPVSATPYTLYISTFLARSVLKYESPSGKVTVLAQFPNVSDEGKSPQTTAGVVVSPDKNNLFVFSPGSDQILMLDRLSGALKRRIRGPYVNTAHDGAIGPDGLLYAVNAPSLTAQAGASKVDTIERYNPATGDHLGTFISEANQPQIRGPFGITFGPDGDVYVSSVLAYGFNPNDFPFRPDHISRYDGKTGKFKAFVARDEHLAFTLAFRPNGELLVPSHFFARVYNYNVNIDQRDDAFCDVNYPIGITYGPDGHFYVASFSDKTHIDLLIADFNDVPRAEGAGSIQRFNGTTGRAEGTVVAGLPFAGFIAFV